jgi:AcrR family transcriptional regulator
MATIAARAGVHEATLYRRWKTKERLVIDAANHRIIDDIPVPDTGSLRGDLIANLQSLRTFLLSALGQALFQTIVVTAHIPEFRAFRKEHWQKRHAQFQVIFDRATQRGECSPQINTQLFLETLAGALYVRLFVANEPVDETLPAQIVDLMLSGGGLP